MNPGEANENYEIGQPVDETSHPNTSQNPITQESSSIPDTLTSRPPKMRKKSKKRSVVWDHFTKPESGDENPISKCNYCHREFCSGSKTNGTSSLKYHLSICKKYLATKPADPKQSIISIHVDSKSHEVTSLTNWKFDQNAIRLALMKMLIIDELPFKFVEGDGFRHFMSVACPRFHINSRWTYARDCFNFFLDEKKCYKSELKRSAKRICLTTDTWTSIQRVNYMCLTAHYIDENWKLNKRILNFCSISSHKGEAIGRAIETCLSAWEIDGVMTVTVDNASSNDVAIDYLRRKMRTWPNTILQAKYLHVRCVAHILNLVVTDGLKEASKSVDRIRQAVKFIRQSPSRLQKFNECVAIEKIDSKCMLNLDCPTRWNSTYKMLDVALKFRNAFERYDDLDPNFSRDLTLNYDGVPLDVDWNNVNSLVVFLRHFYEITLRVSGTKYVTANTFFEEITAIDCLLNELENSDDMDMSAMAIKMRQKYEKYWGKSDKMNKLIYIAAILDPRRKLGYVEFALEHMYGKELGGHLAKSVKDAIYELYEGYKKLASANSQGPQNSIFVASSSSTTSELGNDLAVPVSKLMISKYKRFRSESHSGDAKSDLEKYLMEEGEDDCDDFEILRWWQLNSSRFPLLSEMARDVLAIPMSTVASESAFSTGGRVLDEFRSSLTPKIVESLMCSQDWLQHSMKKIIEKEEQIEEVVKLEQDMVKLGIKVTSDFEYE